MRGALKDEMLQYMRIRLYDAGSAAGETPVESDGKRLLLTVASDEGSLAQSAIDDSNSVFVHVLPIKIASRVWEFQYSAPKDAIIGRLDTLWPYWVLTGGLLSSLLLFGVALLPVFLP